MCYLPEIFLIIRDKLIERLISFGKDEPLSDCNIHERASTIAGTSDLADAGFMQIHLLSKEIFHWLSTNFRICFKLNNASLIHLG